MLPCSIESKAAAYILENPQFLSCQSCVCKRQPSRLPRPAEKLMDVGAGPFELLFLGEETNTHLTATSFQAVVESDKVPP